MDDQFTIEVITVYFSISNNNAMRILDKNLNTHIIDKILPIKIKQ